MKSREIESIKFWQKCARIYGAILLQSRVSIHKFMLPPSKTGQFASHQIMVFKPWPLLNKRNPYLGQLSQKEIWHCPSKNDMLASDTELETLQSALSSFHYFSSRIPFVCINGALVRFLWRCFDMWCFLDETFKVSLWIVMKHFRVSL